MEFTIEQIASMLEGEIAGDKDLKVNTISSIEEGKPGSISFLSNPKYERFLYNTEATAVIVNSDFQPKKEIAATLIKVKDSYVGFTTLLREYQRFMSYQKTGVEKNSFVSLTAKYGENTYIGSFAYIGENVKIGRNVKIYPHVYIGDGVSIGNETIIYTGAKIYADVKIGNHCTLHAGCVIGSDGFGYALRGDGTYENVPHVGNVVLEDHVDIGANAAIDRATFNATIIGKGTKIDNLVQVAHNVEIGENTVIAAQSGISGSSKVGRQVTIAGQVGIVGHIQIGDHVILGAQSGVMKSIPPKTIHFGYPSYEKGQYMKSIVIFRKLPEMMKRIEGLEKKFLNLSAEE